MSHRLAMIIAAERPGVSVTQLCAEAGISRQTFYEIRRRYEKEGLAGLEPVRAERIGMVRSYVDSVTQADLDRTQEPGTPGWPPPAPRTALYCLQVILNDEWAHHQFAIRDLAIIEQC
jgi:hypothetical protein